MIHFNRIIKKKKNLLKHTRLTMCYIKPFFYDIINISLRFSQCYFMNCIGYNTNCIGAVTKSNKMETNTVRIVTNTLRKVTRNIDNIVKKWPNVIHS